MPTPPLRLLGVSLIALAASGCWPDDTPSDATLPVEAEFCQNQAVELLSLVEQVPNTFTPLTLGVYDVGDGSSMLEMPLTRLTPGTQGCWWVELRIELSTNDEDWRYDGVINAPLEIADPSSTPTLSFLLPLDAETILSAYSNVRLVLHGTDTTSYVGSADVTFAAITEAPSTSLARCEERWTTTRELELGDAQSGAFVAYSDAQSAELSYGFQGLAMITPHLRVGNPDDLGEACFHVRLTNQDAAGATLRGGFTNWIRFRRDDDGMLRSDGSIYNEFFASEAKLTRDPVNVEVMVIGGGVATRDAFSVDVVNEEGASE